MKHTDDRKAIKLQQFSCINANREHCVEIFAHRACVLENFEVMQNGESA